MNVLLRQAHGFEGFLAVAEDADALDLATCEVVDIGSRQLVGDSDSTRSPGRADAHGGEDLIAANALQALDPYSEVGTRRSAQNLRIAS